MVSLVSMAAGKGADGPAGPPGARGVDGKDGKDGRDGVDGRNGVDGAPGATGPQGLPGPQGPTGPQGPVGAQGIQGATGATGGTGVSGFPWLYRGASPSIAGCGNGTALTTLTLTGLRLSITTGVTGNFSVGLYGSAGGGANGDHVPGDLLAGGNGVTTTANNIDVSFSYALAGGPRYWVGLISSSACTVRAMATAGVWPALGWTPGATTMVTHLYAAGSGYALPSTAPVLYPGTSSAPAIYLLRSA